MEIVSVSFFNEGEAEPFAGPMDLEAQDRDAARAMAEKSAAQNGASEILIVHAAGWRSRWSRDKGQWTDEDA